MKEAPTPAVAPRARRALTRARLACLVIVVSIPPHAAAQITQPAFVLRQDDSPARAASQAQILRASLQSARTRDLKGVRLHQGELTDPVARKIVDWAIVDVFGQPSDRPDTEQITRELQGWPREDTHELLL